MGQPRLPFSLFLALRYLRPKRTFLSVITLISIVGVVLGITLLILVVSVMTGFHREIQRKILGFEAHLLVNSGGIVRDWRALLPRIREVDGVTGAAPYVQGPVIADFRGLRVTPMIHGIDPDLERGVTEIEGYLIEGRLEPDTDSVVIGSKLAERLGISVGDTLPLYSPGNLDAVFDELGKLEGKAAEKEAVDRLRELVLPAELLVTGIFESGRMAYDAHFLIVPLHVGQELYGLGDDCHGIAVKTSDPFDAPRVQREILERVGPPTVARTWMDLNRELFESIEMERGVLSFLLFFIVIVAAFGIMSTLITITVQKTREIGILKALGATGPQIVRVFLLYGMVVGVLGNGLGLWLGMTLIQYRNEVRDWLSGALGIQVFPASVYQFSMIPAEVVPADVALICVSAFVVCSLAALVPAAFAARLEPASALRYE